MEYIIIFNDLFNNNSKTTCSFNTETERDDYIEKIVSIGLTTYSNIQCYIKDPMSLINIVNNINENINEINASTRSNFKDKEPSLEQLTNSIKESYEKIKNNKVIQHNLDLLAKHPNRKNLSKMKEHRLELDILSKEIMSNINKLIF